LTLCNKYFFIFDTNGSTYLTHPSPASNLKTFQVFVIYFPKPPGFRTIQSYAPSISLLFSHLSFKSSSLVKRVFFLLNAAFSMTMLALISRVQFM